MHLVGILKGSWIFLADLIRSLDLEVTVDFLGFASYGNSPTSAGEVKITKDLDKSIEGLDVLVVEDILDTGLTFRHLEGFLASHKPRRGNRVSRGRSKVPRPPRRYKPVYKAAFRPR